MRKWIVLFSLGLSAMIASPSFVPPPNDAAKIAFQNSIIVKVNGRIISMLDVKKKLDLFFHRNYPQLIQSTPARFQFYQQSWRQVLLEMIDHELILADAATKEVKLSDGEVREEMEQRFGPNTLITLDKIGLSYEEAWKMTKDELIVQRMTWWFIQAKAMQKVAPQDIRQAYRRYLKEHPPYTEWKYQVISVKGEEAEEIAKNIYSLLSQSQKPPEEFLDTFKELKTHSTHIQISQELSSTDQELSDIYKNHLEPLSQGQYSLPLIKTNLAKIFYPHDITKHKAPSFEEIHTKLREELLQNAIREQSIAYISKLRKYYGFDESSLKTTLPEDLEPFSIEYSPL